MPHPKNHLKLTGDTHPPEVEFDLDTRLDDEDLDADLGGASSMLRADSGMGGRTAAMQPPAQQQMQLGASADRYFDAAREQVRSKPYATLGAAFALGFVLAKLFR